MRGTLFLSDGIEASCGAALDAAAPGFTRVVSSPGASEPDYSSIEVLYFSGDVFPERSREFAVAALKSENLRWMHTFSAGVDDAFFRTLIERGVRLTTSSGAQAAPIAQTAILYLLALSRDLPLCLGFTVLLLVLPSLGLGKWNAFRGKLPGLILLSAYAAYLAYISLAG